MTEIKKVKSMDRELEQATKQLDTFENEVKNLTLDRMNEAPKQEVEPQTKLSTREMQKANELWIKPERKIPDNQKFNEKFREEWNFAKEYVQFIAEHKELIGETIEMWTHPFGGVGAEFWKIPTNKAVWAPRYVAEQIRKCTYHRLRMEQGNPHSYDQNGAFYGTMVADTTVSRLTAEPVSQRKSVFMGASGF